MLYNRDEVMGSWFMSLARRIFCSNFPRALYGNGPELDAARLGRRFRAEDRVSGSAVTTLDCEHTGGLLILDGSRDTGNQKKASRCRYYLNLATPATSKSMVFRRPWWIVVEGLKPVDCARSVG